MVTKRQNKVSSLYLAYLPVSEPSISDFISSIPETFTDAADNLIQEITSSNSSSIRISNLSAKTADIAATAPTRSDVTNYIWNNRQMLAKIASKFHQEAGTLNPKVTESIRMLSDCTSQIFVTTHQPNLFAYGGIFRKTLLLNSLKNTILDRVNDNLRIINLFVVVDHDFMDENWIRVAQLPSVRHKHGIFELRFSVNNYRRWLMVCNMPPPERRQLDYWKKQILSWIRKSSLFDTWSLSSARTRSPCSSSMYSYYLDCESPASDIHSKIIENFEQFWARVELSYFRAKSYSDFNAFLMSQIVNSVWEYDTLFVRLTDLSPALMRGYLHLLSNFDEYSGILRRADHIFKRQGIPISVSSSIYLNAPLWLHCKCGSKAPTKLSENALQQQGELLLEGTCKRCKKFLRIDLGKRQRDKKHNSNTDFISDHEVAHRLSPRAIPIPLLLSSELGMSCYVTDGMRYIIYGSQLFKKFSPGNLPLFVVWPARDHYCGLAQREALELLDTREHSGIISYIDRLGKAECTYHSRIGDLIEERNQRIKMHQSIDDILPDLFSLKAEQRNVRRLIKIAEKVKNAIDMRPSVIDYAVNFGLDNTELQWRQNLLSNNSLSTTLKMTTR